jgi:modulator of FtsH protease HflK
MSGGNDSLDVCIIQSFVRFVRRRTAAFVCGVLALVVLIVITCGIYTVPTNQTGALFRFGALIDDHVKTGIHFRLPSPIDRVALMNTTEARRYVLSEKLARTMNMVTGDENLIEIDIAVQYQIQDLGSYLVGSEDWEKLMVLAMQSALAEQVAQMSVDTVLTTGKNQIQVNLRRRLQKTLAAYGKGITIVSTRIVSITPPLEAAHSFRSVSDARSESAKLVSEARSKSNLSLSKARGEGAKILQQAGSTREEILKKSQGETARFTDILVEYRGAKESTRRELYFDRIAKALERAEVILMDPAQPVDLNLFEKKGRNPPDAAAESRDSIDNSETQQQPSVN